MYNFTLPKNEEDYKGDEVGDEDDFVDEDKVNDESNTIWFQKKSCLIDWIYSIDSYFHSNYYIKTYSNIKMKKIF